MAKYYPMMLNIENKQCLVVGGGNIAYRKCLELIQYGGLVTVIADKVNEDFTELIDNKSIKYIKDYYKKSYIEGIFMVIASTGDKNVNSEIFHDCNDKGILVNNVDNLINCNFIVPAKIRRGDLTISVSTNGKSPTISRKIREELEKKYDEGYGTLVDILGELREEVINNVEYHSQRKALFEKMSSEEYLQKLKVSSKEAVKEEIRKLISEYAKD